MEVPTLEGRARLTIKPGTQSGSMLRLKGKGLPSTEGYGRGDLIINVLVYVPENLSANEKQIFEKLRDSENLKPTEEKRESLFAKIKYLFTRQ